MPKNIQNQEQFGIHIDRDGLHELLAQYLESFDEKEEPYEYIKIVERDKRIARAELEKFAAWLDEEAK